VCGSRGQGVGDQFETVADDAVLGVGPVR